MKHKVEIFCDDHPGNLKERVNRFFAESQDSIRVISIEYSTSRPAPRPYSVLIHYKENSTHERGMVRSL